MRQTSQLDGGGTLAADDAGNVYVAWHGRTEQSRSGEMGRRMWVAKSTDNGASFSAEVPGLRQGDGACGCCGTRALADKHGTIYVLYRAATDSVGRDMYLLTSRDRDSLRRGEYPSLAFNACPMSSESLAEDCAGVLAAWETDQRVFFARIDPKSAKVSKPISPPGSGSQTPERGVERQGRDDPGVGRRDWMAEWRGLGVAGLRSVRPTTDAKGRVEAGIPVWGLPTVVARPDGSFLIIH